MFLIFEQKIIENDLLGRIRKFGETLKFLKAELEA